MVLTVLTVLACSFACPNICYMCINSHCCIPDSYANDTNCLDCLNEGRCSKCKKGYVLTPVINEGEYDFKCIKGRGKQFDNRCSKCPFSCVDGRCCGRSIKDKNCIKCGTTICLQCRKGYGRVIGYERDCYKRLSNCNCKSGYECFLISGARKCVFRIPKKKD
jgi:hypothetical protein